MWKNEINKSFAWHKGSSRSTEFAMLGKLLQEMHQHV